MDGGSLPPGFQLLDEPEEGQPSVEGDSSLPPGFVLQGAEPGWQDYAHGVAGGFNRGLASIAGAPVDLVNLGLRQVGLGSEKPFLGSESIKGMMEGASDLATGNPEAMTYGGPDTPGGRIMSRAGEEFGAAALPSMALLRAAQKTGQAVRAAPTLWETVAAPLRNTPGRATAGEAAATAGAGTAAGIAREVDPDNPVAENLAQLAGGMTPTVLAHTPSALGVRAARRLYDELSPEGQARAGRDLAREVLGDAMTTDARAELERAEQLQRAIPGFNPSLGEATNSPALLATQRDIERRASGGDLEQIAARRRTSERAVEDFARTQAPGGEIENPADYLHQRFENIRGRVGQAEHGLLLQRQGLADRLERADRTVAGRTIRDRLGEQRRASSERMTQIADELGLNSVDFRAPFADWRQRLVREFSPRSQFDRVTDSPDVLRTLANWDDNQPITFTDLRALRERVTGDLRDELARPDRRSRLIRSLVGMRERVDDMIDDVTERVDPNLAQRYRDFRTVYREQHVERFETPTPYNLGKVGPRGFSITSDEDVAGQFFRAGDVTAARDFNRIFRGDPEAHAALESWAIDDMRLKAVGDDGTINPRKFSNWMRQHENVLAEFPHLRGRLRDLQSADEALIQRQVELVDRRNTFDRDALVRAITNYAAKGQSDPRGIIQNALAEPRQMQRLWGALGDNEAAKNGLRRLVWDSVSTRTGDELGEFLASRRGSLRLMFGSDHLKALEDIATARAMMERTPQPGGRGYEPRPLANVERLIGQGLPQLSSRFFAFRTGRVQKGYLAVDTFMRSLRGRAQASAEDAFKAALYDKDVAKALLITLRSGEMAPATAKRLRTRLFALGLPYSDDEQVPPSPPPLSLSALGSPRAPGEFPMPPPAAMLPPPPPPPRSRPYMQGAR